MSGAGKETHEVLLAQRLIVEQLRAEASARRIPLTQSLSELVKFCEQHQTQDVLVSGFAKPQDNPFREKGGCSIV